MELIKHYVYFPKIFLTLKYDNIFLFYYFTKERTIEMKVKKAGKRALSVLIASLMVLSLVPLCAVTASAATDLSGRLVWFYKRR